MAAYFELMFTSDFCADAEPAEIAQIIRVSRAKNVAASLTGLLMFDGARFCQHLEGPEAAVRATVARIAADPRHSQFTQLHAGGNGRAGRFSAWQIGILMPDGPSPLLALGAMRGPAAVDHLLSLFRERQKFGMHVV